MKKALIFGSRGQDGRLLWAYLKGLGYALTGFGAHDAVDIRDAAQVADVISHLAPDEIYYLAAIHSSSEKAGRETSALFEQMFQVNFLSYLHVLNAVAQTSRHSKVFFAASSHVFGGQCGDVQNETTPLNPESLYAITKANGIWASRWFRQQGIFSTSGILYTHESPLRAPAFLSRKVVRAVATIQRGECEELVLGDLSGQVDWGYASDFVRAMHAILQLDKPDDFVIATGVKHSVRDFVSIAFEMAGLDWRSYVKEDPSLLQRASVVRVGDSSKLTAMTGWKPTMTFEGMIRELLKAEGANLV